MGRRSAWGIAVATVLAGCGQLPTAGQATLAGPSDHHAEPAASVAGPDTAAAAGSSSDAEVRGRLPLVGAARARPPAAPQPTSAAPGPGVPRLPERADRIAVIVGIDDYPGEDADLTAAVADARLVRRALSRLGFGEMEVLVGAAATKEAIVSAVRWLAARSRPGTTGVFFFAGHVRQIHGDADGDGEEQVDEAMVAADGRVILDGELASTLAPATGPLWLAYASCYAQGFSDAAAPGRVSSYAAGETSLAYESTALGHSFMAEYLIRRGILEEGLTSVEALHGYARKHMRGSDRRFRPLVDDRLEGPLELGAREEPERPAQRRPTGKVDPGRSCLVVLRCRG